jgi:tetratricopeptide (TPR) repeat protein
MGVLAAILWLAAPAHEDLELQIARLSEQIRREPERAILYYRRGELRRMHEEWTGAREDLERAAALDPELAVADLALGRLWNQAGDPRRARTALDRFLKRSPDHGEALLERARARAALGDRDGALDDYGRGIPLLEQPRPENYIERAELLRAGKRPDEAIRALEEGIRKLGPALPLQLALLDLELDAARFDAALARVDEIARASERKDLWLVRRGEILRQAGRAAEAAEAFRAALASIDALPAARRRTKFTKDLENRVRAELEALR